MIANIWFFLLPLLSVVYSEDPSSPPVTCLATATNKDKKCLHRLYGTKTTYQDAVESIKDSITNDWKIDDKCSPVSLYLFKRHAIRFPDGEDIPDMEMALNEVRERVLEAASRGKTFLCQEDIDVLRQWKLSMTPENDNLITDSGVKETERIAKELQEVFPDLLTPGSNVKLDIAISNRIRTNQTAEAFVASLLNKPKHELKKEEFNPEMKLDLTDFHTECHNSLKKQGVLLKKPAAYNDFLKSSTMESVRQSVSARLGLDTPVDPSLFKIIFRGCAFGHAIFNGDAWCSAFSNRELRLIELLEDLDDYFGDAYGRNINSKAPCSLTHDILDQFRDIIDKTDDRTRKTFLRFTHAGAMKQLISYLGLYDVLNMNIEPTSTTRCRSKPDFYSRDWRSSLLSPFSANFVFTLYKCQSDNSDPQFKVLTKLQGYPVAIKGCPSGLCPFEKFEQILSRIPKNDCNHDKLCRV